MADVVALGLALILAGICVTFAAMALSGEGGARTKGGAVLLIGPIPVVFGSDAKWATATVALVIVLVVLSLLA